MKTELIPQAIEAEESLLCSLILGENAPDLKPEEFFSPRNQKIFKAICGLIEKGIAVDLPSLAMALKDAGELEAIGGAYYLASIIEQVPVASNLEHYAGRIRDKALLRKLLSACQETTRECLDNTNEPAAIIDQAKGRIDSIIEGAGNHGREKIISYRELSLDAGERYAGLYERKGSITGIASGFFVLDSILCGFQPGDLIILAARPSQGKTALALNIGGHIAGKGGIPVAYFSLEMSASQLFDRQLSGESGINLQKFRTGRFERGDWDRINEAQGKVYSWPVYIDDSAALHYQEIRRRAWGLKKRHGIGLVIIDHLQLVKGDREATRDREIGSITAGMKAIAKELDLPVVLLSQLNRQLETRSNPHKRPRLSDLRDSGNIEQDADVIMFLYRPAVYEDTEGFPGHTELIIAKHRNGPTGMIKLLWNERITTFLNVELKRQV
ncbi:replicative DNA helicase [Candidatus Parcubacteria bacterium]|nr:MAG: replicative DNA helicase [Candidatus Parcubacteria bacterium]